MNHHCDLDLKNNNLIFTQNTAAFDIVASKFGCKKISSSADMVETVISNQMSPNQGLEPQDRKQIFLHDNLTHDVASPYHTNFGYRRFSSRGDII